MGIGGQRYTWPLYLWEGTPFTVMKVWKLNFSFANYVLELNSAVTVISRNVCTMTTYCYSESIVLCVLFFDIYCFFFLFLKNLQYNSLLLHHNASFLKVLFYHVNQSSQS